MNYDVNKQFRMAIQGDPEQLYKLGMRYYTGDEVVKDCLSAQALFTQSAELGFKESQFHLAFMYYEGLGIGKDYKMANYWFEKCARAGNIWGQFYLALIQRNQLLNGKSRKLISNTQLTNSINMFKLIGQEVLNTH